jgi:hypothetical protein
MASANHHPPHVEPRPGRKVTIEHLEALNTSQDTHFLYCRKCDGTYSADHRDYFWARKGHTFKCCGVNNYLCRRRAEGAS